jgi:hypothetical protein
MTTIQFDTQTIDNIDKTILKGTKFDRKILFIEKNGGKVTKNTNAIADKLILSDNIHIIYTKNEAETKTRKQSFVPAPAPAPVLAQEESKTETKEVIKNIAVKCYKFNILNVIFGTEIENELSEKKICPHTFISNVLDGSVKANKALMTKITKLAINTNTIIKAIGEIDGFGKKSLELVTQTVVTELFNSKITKEAATKYIENLKLSKKCKNNLIEALGIL